MISVWDPLVRIFHWLLVISFSVAYLLEDTRFKLHLLAGSIVFGLVVFRLIWGWVGTPHSRFADFPWRPRQVLRHFGELLRGHAHPYTGHTPAGSAMIVALLTGLLLLSLSGVALYGFQEARGPLAGLMAPLSLEGGYLLEDIHDLIATGLVALISLHIAGVILESLLQRQNLARAMITGRKPLAGHVPAQKE